MIWWNEITKFEQLLYIVATASSVVLLVYTVLSMIGLEKSKADDELRIVSFRNFLSFLAVGSWLSIVFYKVFEQQIISIVIGAAGACLIVAAVNIISKMFLKKYNTSEVDINKTVGMVATVYESLPKKGTGKGRISLEIEGEYKVFGAISYAEKKLSIGKKVRIKEVTEDNLLLVEEEVAEE